MSISGISSNSNAYSPSASNRNSFRADFSDLANALSAGDLSGAQSAFAALQQLQPGRFTTAPSTASASGVQSVGGGSTIGNDIAALGQALQSGDLSAAQSAFQKVQQDMGSVHHGHRHHHHMKADDAQQSQTSTAGTNPTDLFGQGQSGVLA